MWDEHGDDRINLHSIVQDWMATYTHIAYLQDGQLLYSGLAGHFFEI